MKLYRDKSELFQCSIEIEGADISESQARLVLQFDNNQNLLFYGKIDENGLCKVDIPAIKTPPSEGGKVVLEVIAESSFSTPWESNFEVVASKKVSIKEVKFQNEQDEISSKPKVVVKPLEEKKETPSPKQLSVEIKKGITDRSKSLVRESLQTFAKLTPEKRHQLIETVQNYEPSTTIQKWSERTFSNPQDIHTKVCMYLAEKGVRSS